MSKPMPYTGTVTFYRDEAGQKRMRIQARNGRVVGPTESFSQPRRALLALQRALVNPRIVWLE